MKCSNSHSAETLTCVVWWTYEASIRFLVRCYALFLSHVYMVYAHRANHCWWVNFCLMSYPKQHKILELLNSSLKINDSQLLIFDLKYKWDRESDLCFIFHYIPSANEFSHLFVKCLPRSIDCQVHAVLVFTRFCTCICGMPVTIIKSCETF